MSQNEARQPSNASASTTIGGRCSLEEGRLGGGEGDERGIPDYSTICIKRINLQRNFNAAE